ncbi:rRNA cytosine-C5-methyltransferase [Parabacteroides sp. PF5-9]|uniref:methyltransferase RsmF C-terminal domain-like protein n=1 Tax=Parabacteroides sp. PF5-9 TaxID=1742404 RepID=UPI00247505CA|nr:rRNA cytosine-C5-methyltransferase [Parabacteroides sp. PF5-9]
MILPPDFIRRTKALLGADYDSLENALHEDSPVSIRLNRDKLSEEFSLSEKVVWSETGFYLPERLAFTFDPLFHAGGYYVQEASSMFLEQVIRAYITEPVVCLDLCAAPGGKSTHLAALLPENSLLVSNEVIRSRSYILAENISKWGSPDTIVLNNDPAEIGEMSHLFDLIVADLPCSGEGMFRKDPESIKEWSVNNVDLCAARQRRIIHDIWEALKPGGLLVYSTCTFNVEENEENIRYIREELGAEVLPVSFPSDWAVAGPLKYANPVYRFFPHKVRGEGFFLAVLQKTDGPVSVRKNKNRKTKNKTIIPSGITDWLLNADRFQIENRKEALVAIPSGFMEIYSQLADRLKIVSAGVPLGEVKGKDCVPIHGLALSTAFDRSSFPSQELEWEQAIRFLRKESVVLPEEIGKGYVLLTYEQQPLGFVKHLVNRSNNLYPQEWRIRSGHLPEKIPSLYFL